MDRLPSRREEVVVACDRTTGTGADLLLPCLAALPMHLALAVAVQGCRGLELRSGNCEECDRAAASREIPKAVERAMAWLQATYHRLGLRRTTIPGDRNQGLGMTRRGFFAMLRPRWDLEGSNPPPRIPGSRGDLLDALAQAGPLPDRAVPGSSFFDLQIGPTCHGCTVCRDVCPVGAIRREEVSGGVEIRFNPCLCTGCGNCVTCCLPRAASLYPLAVQDLARRAQGVPDSHRGLTLWETRTRLLYRPCPTCGAPVPGGQEAPCMTCRQRRARDWSS